jgi:PAS domain S-box-containing protein
MLEDERHAEEAALAAIVRSSSDAVIAKTVDGIVTAWNAGATSVYGYIPAEMLGRNIEVTIPREDSQEERDRHARVATGVPESGYRCVRLRADGGRVEVVMSMSPVRDAQGRIVGVASISRPVSAQESVDARVAALLEGAPDAMVCADAEGRIVLVNGQVGALFGYAREELIGASVDILVPEKVRGRHPAYRAEFLRNPQPRPMGSGLSLRGRRRDGTTFPVEVSLAEDHTGGHVLVIAAIRDVTEHQAIEAALRESENRLRQLAETVDTVFTLRELDPPSYLYVSPGVHALTGIGVEELQRNPRALIDLVHPEDRERVMAALERPASPGEVIHSEHRIIRRDGKTRWIRISATPVPTEAGSPLRIATSAEDITDRVEAIAAISRAEAAARAANDAKNEFLSRMSHELRTPLNAVLGFGQLLERRLADTPHVESVRHILHAGRHLLDLINEVLDIARIEAGTVSLSPEPVPLDAIVQETAQLMEPLAQNAGVTIRIDGGTAGHVLADRQRLRLRQILLNLMSNAIKYNHPGGGVWLSWTVADGRTAIRVRDDGPGIAAALHDRLFVPFDRLGAENTAVEGTGVGLTVTRGLVELMHGSVSCQSAPGAGATFTVVLPTSPDLEVRHGSAGGPLSLHPSGGNGPDADGTQGTATVLYIEDNEPNVRVMESLLELRPEWRLIHAALGRLGIDLARSHRPDLLLLDLHLPDGSGSDVLAAVKSDPELAQIPVVVLSADASQHQVDRLLAAGAKQYLTKPLDVDEVLTLLDGCAPSKLAGPRTDVDGHR